MVLASEKGIVNTGCTATVDRVLREYPDGRLDILTRGQRRFEILLLNDERSFLRGAVEFFDDDADPGPPAPDLLRSVLAGYYELGSATASDPMEPEAGGDPRLSFRLARDVPDLEFRQTLLATRSEAERIRRIADFLPRFLDRRKKIQHTKNVAGSNGHGRKAPDPSKDPS